MTSRSSGKAIGRAVSDSQQILIELENPEIEQKRKHAISKSPPIRDNDLCIPENLPRTWIQFKKGADKEKYMQRFLENYTGKPEGFVMKPMKVKL
jgi:hypothetical protein